MKIVITGPPISQSRHRMCARNGKSIIYDPDSAEKKLIKSFLVQYCKEHDIKALEEHVPASLEIEFHLPIPKSLTEKQRSGKIGSWHTSKPDLDNYCKLYFDCISEILMHDDRQICRLTASKKYSDDPKTILEITCAI